MALPVNHPLATLSNQVSVQVSTQAIDIIFSTLDDVIDYSNQAGNQVSNQVNYQLSDQVIRILKEEICENVVEILNMIRKGPKTSKEILQTIGLSKHSTNRKRHIDPLKEIGWSGFAIPENLNDRNQKYRITASGFKVSNLIKQA